MKKFTILFLLPLLSLFACNTEESQSGPQISINSLGTETITVEDEQFFAVQSGEALPLSAMIKGDTPLTEYRFEIHIDDGNDHNHRGKSSEVAWEFTKTILITDQPMEIDLNTTVTEVPSTGIKSGKYHFGLYARDEFGKENSEYIDFYILEEE
ncbi:DUF4625 domain-containing protein [Persicobacter sp. CCB-QB2]|uniref:DUF4625 domain-containing protein n=1 Tax=Persicobacter sp. CCB-QB2 TaxID=1561025 RepID=UPI0006A973A7|nr:DUF4625 domain-containing protein [Persicobacter sp. CCB-QB2]